MKERFGGHSSPWPGSYALQPTQHCSTRGTEHPSSLTPCIRSHLDLSLSLAQSRHRRTSLIHQFPHTQTPPDQVIELHGLPGDRVLVEFLYVGDCMHDVEDRAIDGAHRILKGLEGDGAAVEGQALEWDAPGASLVSAPLLLPLGCGEIGAILLNV